MRMSYPIPKRVMNRILWIPEEMVLTKVDIDETIAQSFGKILNKGGHRKMEMCYDGALVMPSNYVVMSEDEMTYVEGGMKGKTSTKTERIVTASVIAADAAFVGKLTYNAFKALAVTACTGLALFFAALGSCALMAATGYEAALAATAAAYASSGKNYSYTYYAFGSYSYYTSVKAL